MSDIDTDYEPGFYSFMTNKFRSTVKFALPRECRDALVELVPVVKGHLNEIESIISEYLTKREHHDPDNSPTKRAGRIKKKDQLVLELLKDLRIDAPATVKRMPELMPMLDRFSSELEREWRQMKQLQKGGRPVDEAETFLACALYDIVSLEGGAPRDAVMILEKLSELLPEVIPGCNHDVFRKRIEKARIRVEEVRQNI